ncbi:NrsF family protein [Phreatobacter stygius]|uniref:DUF1109 family protein n=1 Tax=Phreatobacter stygius TaxID=1940610 RepID=A0A4D7B2Y2_9HYPH|nr:NrsF family protein [Phreatobacter stygius]QCI65413.1 DUF1109 family protein [Phreatobacter stygius]
MKTDDLIAALSRDATLTEAPASRRIALALVVSAVIAFALLMLVVKPRSDLAEAATTMLFDLKMVYVATLVVGAVALLRAAARPEGVLSPVLLLVPAALMLFGLGHELATQAPAAYGTRLVGRNWALCLVAIPFMAAAPLAAILAAMRAGAPADPTRAGAIAGFAAGAIAAVFYGLHCVDDSPLFVATWYTVAIGVMAAAGAAIGRRVLAW